MSNKDIIDESKCLYCHNLDMDGQLPKFCKACATCAYTAFSSSHRRWLEE